MTPAKNQLLHGFGSAGVEVWMKRLDLQFPETIGNKFYKLKYNLQEAKAKNCKTILTFGGAFSNHIAAIAELTKYSDFKVVGVIRGEELGKDFPKTLASNPTLQKSYEKGMQFLFISRDQYRQKEKASFLTGLKERFPGAYIIPEGGTNALAIKGCREILAPSDADFDFVTCPVGTGGTMAGIIQSTRGAAQEVLGFSAIKPNMNSRIEELTREGNWRIFGESMFGGFAKINGELISFINRFAQRYGVPLDPIYNAKMMFALQQKIMEGFFRPGSKILVINTGGLQGALGMNLSLKRRGLSQIYYR